MERHRNWQGWAALALAGLALLVAVGGRGPWHGGYDRYARVVAVPAAPAAPSAPEAPGMRFGRGEQLPPEVAADMERHRADADRQMADMERQMADADRQMAHSGHGRFGRDWGGPMGHGFGHGRFFPLFGLVRGLVNLAALGLLGYVLYTVWRQRRTPPAAATTPAGHDPRVE